uniref:18S ribosomal RNA intron 1 ORF n=1 Tax=Picea glauca TaxID=3330 RepID=A0A101LZF7_PICGL|nr:18S ribosomal RNA intron 1 ORF [Picea glauca]
MTARKKQNAFKIKNLGYIKADDGRFLGILPRVAAHLISLFREHKNKYGLSQPQVETIVAALTNKSFRFSEMRRIYIPKPHKPGQLRPITTPHTSDIIVMDALSEVLNMLLRDIFLPCSHGFRKKRSGETLFMDVLSWGPIDQFVVADIVKCFDNLEHKRLLMAVQSFIDDDGIVNLINSFLITDILDREGINYNYSVKSKGIAQGCSLSPVLLNIYLHSFDLAMSRFSGTYPLVRYARYADDILLAFRSTGPQINEDNQINDQRVHQFLPRCGKATSFLLESIKERELELKMNTYKDCEPFLFLGIRVLIEKGGNVNLMAPMARIHHKIRQMGPPWLTGREDPKKPKPTIIIRKMEDKEIISFFNKKVVAYLSFYSVCSNAFSLKDSLKREILERCVENLALSNRTTITSIKRKYGSRLERAKVPFLSDRKIDLILKKLLKGFQERKKKLDHLFPGSKLGGCVIRPPK